MTTQSNSIAYFNVHTEALGYLDSLKLVSPKPGQNFEPFYHADFCMLEGDPKNPDKTYVSLRIPGQNVVDELVAFSDDINNRDVKVFVGLRLAKFRAVPFQKGISSQNPGQLGVNYEARLIKVMFMKVGSTLIRLKRETLKNTEPNLSLGQAPQQVPENSVEFRSAFEMPLSVKLSSSESYFEQNKVRLEEQGYQWHIDSESWVLPQVTLSKEDPEFKRKIFELKQEGYRWESTLKVWRKTLGTGPIAANVSQTQTINAQVRHN